MKIIASLFLLASFESQAFILVSPYYRLADPEKVKIKISSEGCSANGVSDEVLKDAIEFSVDIWNGAPESRLRLSEGGTSSTSVNSATAPKGEIIVGCGPLATGIGGSAYPDETNGSTRIILNSNRFTGNYSVDELYGTLAHEVGHGVGLNHSNDRASVMTYESNGWSPKPSYLSQDDVDGVVYLYPNKEVAGGLTPSCSSFADDRSTKRSMLLEGALGFLSVGFIVLAIKKLLRWLQLY